MEGFDPKTSFGHEVSKRYDTRPRGDEEETVAFLAKLADGGDALELAVGTGRIALPLSQAGLRVDGIELSPDMVDRMREKPGGNAIEVTIGDMSRASTGHRYRLVYLVYNTIGNLLTQDDQVACFQNAARHLDPGGVFALECRIPTAPARPGHQFVDAEEISADNVVLGVCHYDPVTQILDNNHVRIGAAASCSHRSASAWPTRPNSTSWPASPGSGCARDGADGTANPSPPPAGATSAFTSEHPAGNRAWKRTRAHALQNSTYQQHQIVPRALPVRDLPARSPSAAIAGHARSHGSGSYQVDAHDPVAGGRDSAAAARVHDRLRTPAERVTAGSSCRAGGGHRMVRAAGRRFCGTRRRFRRSRRPARWRPRRAVARG